MLMKGGVVDELPSYKERRLVFGKAIDPVIPEPLPAKDVDEKDEFLELWKALLAAWATRNELMHSKANDNRLEDALLRARATISEAGHTVEHSELLLHAERLLRLQHHNESAQSQGGSSSSVGNGHAGTTGTSRQYDGVNESLLSLAKRLGEDYILSLRLHREEEKNFEEWRQEQRALACSDELAVNKMLSEEMRLAAEQHHQMRKLSSTDEAYARNISKFEADERRRWLRAVAAKDEGLARDLGRLEEVKRERRLRLQALQDEAYARSLMAQEEALVPRPPDTAADEALAKELAKLGTAREEASFYDTEWSTHLKVMAERDEELARLLGKMSLDEQEAFLAKAEQMRAAPSTSAEVVYRKIGPLRLSRNERREPGPSGSKESSTRSGASFRVSGPEKSEAGPSSTKGRTYKTKHEPVIVSRPEKRELKTSSSIDSLHQANASLRISKPLKRDHAASSSSHFLDGVNGPLMVRRPEKTPVAPSSSKDSAVTDNAPSREAKTDKRALSQSCSSDALHRPNEPLRLSKPGRGEQAPSSSSDFMYNARESLLRRPEQQRLATRSSGSSYTSRASLRLFIDEDLPESVPSNSLKTSYKMGIAAASSVGKHLPEKRLPEKRERKQAIQRI